MKKVLILSSIALVSIIFPLSVFAQSDEETNEFPLVYTESILRDADGNLILYKENYSVHLFDHEVLHQLLDQEKIEGNNATLIDIGGATHEMIQIESVETFEREDLRGWDSLGVFVDDEEEIQQLALFLHEGYPVIPGDELTIIWTFVRAVT